MTVQEILNAAYAKSLYNRSLNVTEGAAVVGVVARALLKYVVQGAAINPEFFGDAVAIPEVAGTWARPADAISVYWVEDAAGEQVIVLTTWDRRAHEFEPAIHLVGRLYQGVGQSTDPTGSLTFYYVPEPELPAALADEVDANWPEAFNNLLILEVMIHLASQEKSRMVEGGDLAKWQADLATEVAIFEAFLRQETVRHGRSAPRSGQR